MMGGGFFGSGASRTDTTSNASQTTQNNTGGGAPLSLSNIGTSGKGAVLNMNVTSHSTNTDYGAIDSAFGFGNDALNFASKALSDTSAFAYDGISLAADVMNNSAYLAYDGLNIASGLVGDALVMNTDMSLAVLNSSEKFADNAALLSLEHTKMGNQIASYAMDSVYRSSLDSKHIAQDSMNKVASAYNFANQGLLALTSDNAARLAAIQNSSLDVINKNSAAAQASTEKAMDYIFESSKTAEERIIKDSTKWLIGGLVAVAAVFVFPSFAKALR